MKSIELDASGWSRVQDVYRALLASIGAPNWHGININALIDSMIYGGINSVHPPLSITINGLDKAAAEAREELKLVFDALAEEGALLESDDVVLRLEIERYNEPSIPDNFDKIVDFARKMQRP